MNIKLALTTIAVAGIGCFAVHEHVEKNRLTNELRDAKMELVKLSGVALELEQLVYQLENKSVFDGVTAVYGRVYNQASSFFLFSFTSSSPTTDNGVSPVDSNDKAVNKNIPSVTSTPSKEKLPPPDPPTAVFNPTMYLSLFTAGAGALHSMPMTMFKYGIVNSFDCVCSELLHQLINSFDCMCSGLLQQVIQWTTIQIKTNWQQSLVCGLLFVVGVIVWIYYNPEKTSLAHQAIRHFATNFTPTLQATTTSIISSFGNIASAHGKTLLQRVSDLVMNAFRDLLHKLSTISMSEMAGAFCTDLKERTRSIFHVAGQFIDRCASTLFFNKWGLLLFVVGALASKQSLDQATQLALCQMLGMWIYYRSGKAMGYFRLSKLLVTPVVMIVATIEMRNEKNSAHYRLGMLFVALSIPVYYAKLLVYYVNLGIMSIMGKCARTMRHIFFGNEIAEAILFLIHAGSMVHAMAIAEMPPYVFMLVLIWVFYVSLWTVEDWGRTAGIKQQALFAIKK
jgi:hypothetical protein